jgi:integrase
MKIDPYKHKEKYLKWKERNKSGIPGISKFNSDMIMDYLSDMEIGMNICAMSVKGPRSYIRLNAIHDKIGFFARRFKEYYKLDRMIDITEFQLISFFSDMRNGNIKKVDGGTYRGLETFTKAFKAFWHWHQKVSKKNGVEIPDITVDLDTKQEKPDWVYLNEKEVKLLCENASYEYKVLIMFLFDTGIRAPTELMNIRVADLFNDCKELNIRQEASKTFGRRIKLMLCSDLMKNYIQIKKLNPEDYIFTKRPGAVNQVLKRLAARVFGDTKISQGGQKYCDLTMYDFRHCACCYWLPRYKSESALKYRFGWKKSDKIHYYSEMLGMSDTISEDDMFVDVTKTEIEKKLDKSKKENEVLQERLISMENYMVRIAELVNKIHLQVDILEGRRNDTEICTQSPSILA